MQRIFCLFTFLLQLRNKILDVCSDEFVKDQQLKRIEKSGKRWDKRKAGEKTLIDKILGFASLTSIYRNAVQYPRKKWGRLPIFFEGKFDLEFLG